MEWACSELKYSEVKSCAKRLMLSFVSDLMHKKVNRSALSSAKTTWRPTTSRL